MRVVSSSLCLALVTTAAAACGGRDASRAASAPAGQAPLAAGAAPVAAAEPARLRPAPGAELVGPVAPPAAQAPGARREPAETLDLGKDRPVVALDLPEPPRGGAASFEMPDGRRGWIARIPEGVQLPTVAYGDGRVYVSGGFEAVSFYALDAETGHAEWASLNLEDNGPTAPIYEDGRVIFNTESCTLFVMDAQTGRKLWFKYLGDPTLSQPAVADGLVFAAHPSPLGHSLTAYKVRSGAVAWTRGIGHELLAAPVVHGDSVYASDLNGRVYRLRRRDGKVYWSKSIGASTAPWIDGDRLYVSRRDGKVEEQVVLETSDGKLVAEQHAVEAKYLGDIPRDLNDWKKIWAFEGSRPVVHQGVKYEAMGGFVSAADPATGEALWRRRWAPAEAARSLGTVALAGAQVVVSTRSGEVFGLDVDTGYTLWSYGIGKKIVAEPVVAKGWIYAATTDGSVVALQVADASLDGWHMWGGNPFHNGPVEAKAPGAAN